MFNFHSEIKHFQSLTNRATFFLDTHKNSYNVQPENDRSSKTAKKWKKGEANNCFKQSLKTNTGGLVVYKTFWKQEERKKKWWAWVFFLLSLTHLHMPNENTNLRR